MRNGFAIIGYKPMMDSSRNTTNAKQIEAPLAETSKLNYSSNEAFVVTFLLFNIQTSFLLRTLSLELPLQVHIAFSSSLKLSSNFW